MGNIKEGNELEKHYTPTELMEYCYNIIENNVNFEITEWLENSAGSGNIIDFIKTKSDKPIIAYDILNETGREDIKECNYLKEKIGYKQGRVGFINPPFNKGLKFVYKTLEECDYVVCILALNSLLNLDYEKYKPDDITVWKGYQFEKCKTNIVVMGISKI